MRKRNPEFKLRDLKPDSVERRDQGYRYIATGYPAGKRKRKCFRHGEKRQAELWVQKENTKLKNMGTRLESVMSDGDFLEEAAKAHKELQKHGASLTDAVAHYLNHLRQKASSVSISQLKEEFYLSKQRARKDKSPRYLKDLDQKLSAFVDSFGDQISSEVSTDSIEEWLDSLNVGSLTTVHGYFRAIRGLFNFAKRKGYVKESPLDSIDQENIKPHEMKVEVLTLKQASKVLSQAPARVVPSIVLGLFCGLRTVEVQRLDWSNVDLRRRQVYLPSDITKTGQARWVTISDNAVEWLRPYDQSEGSIRPAEGEEGYSAFRREMSNVAKTCGIGKWKNHLRHSFASYHYALHRNMESTVAELGHQNRQITWKHYQKAVSHEDAERFWQIYPVDSSSIIAMK